MEFLFAAAAQRASSRRLHLPPFSAAAQILFPSDAPLEELPMGSPGDRPRTDSAAPGSDEDAYLPVSARAQAALRLTPSAPSASAMDEAEIAEAELDDDDDDDEADVVKILMLGDSGVGKTCCMHSFVEGKFSSTLMATAGVEFQMKTIRVRTRRGRRKVSLQIWDTAGQERFQKITRAFYKHTDGVVFTYDVSDRKSFDNLQKWVAAMQSEVTTATAMRTMLIGNKVDLPARAVRCEARLLSAAPAVLPFFVSSPRPSLPPSIASAHALAPARPTSAPNHSRARLRGLARSLLSFRCRRRRARRRRRSTA